MTKFKQILVTPEMAKMYLGENINNRKIKQHRVQKYSYDILTNNWKENTGETIKISKTGRLLDGQHRLLAIIKANKPLLLDFAFDLDEQIFDVLDTGLNRSSADVFDISGVKYSTLTPSAINLFNTLKTETGYTKERYNKSNAIILAQYEENKEFWDYIIPKSKQLYNSIGQIVSPTVIAGVYAFLYEKNPDLSTNFMNQLCTGENITNNSIYLLRNKLAKDKISNLKMNQETKCALIIKVWNSFIRNTKIDTLRYNPMSEKFPKALL